MSEDTGFVQDTFDTRDLYYRAGDGIQPPQSVNLRDKFKDDFSNVYDQGWTKSCTANAVTACFWFEEKAGRRKEVWGEAGPSRWFVYWLARGGYESDDHELKGDGPKNTGSNSRDAMRGISKCGACVESDCPFPDTTQIYNQISTQMSDQLRNQIKETEPGLNDEDLANKVQAKLQEKMDAEMEKLCSTKPSKDAFKNAAPHNDAYYYRLDPDRPDSKDKDLKEDEMKEIGARLLSDLKKCLTEGYPVSFGYWNYLGRNDGRWQEKSGELSVLTDPWAARGFPRNTFPENLTPAVSLGGHSILAIGYDDKAGPDGKGAVLCQNSWGAGWSQGGLFWMPYPWITDFAASNDFWTIRSEPIKGKPLLWEEVHARIATST